MPCSPNDVTLNIPEGPTGPSIAGFGLPFTVDLPNISFDTGAFPEDLLDLLDKLQMLIPSGALKAPLNPNFGKDVFDSIMKLLDQFFPFLMLYKFFLPILNIIICIIEVLCSLTNPFKLIRALKRLFRVCIPEFLNLFPIFAIIIMIISLLLLLLALIEYIVNQIIKFIKAILRNVIALGKAFADANKNSVMAIAKKLGALLCIFQNLFVLLSIFNIIIQIIKDILSMLFAIPPCDDGDTSDDGCCTPDVCPAIVKNEYTRLTGSFQYYKKYGFDTGLVIPGFPNASFDLRAETWQLFDPSQEIAQKFINIIDAYDLPTPVFFFTPKQVFFPTDVTYSAKTSPRQAAYVLDLRLLYNPASFGRSGSPKYIRFKNCIMQVAPTAYLSSYDNSLINKPTGVVKLVGGYGYEDNGTTVLTGYAADGVTTSTDQATLENFIHKVAVNSVSPSLIDDGVLFTDVEYTFKPNLAALINKSLVTSGCSPSFALDRAYINNVFAGDIGLKIAQLDQLFNNPNAKTGLNFPDPAACQACLQLALNNLRNNLTVAGVAEFDATANICLKKLKDETTGALSTIIGIGFEPCNSSFKIEPALQFTSKPIKVTVDLKERNSLSLINSLPAEVASDLAQKINAHITFGSISKFAYDGYTSFIADISSDNPGNGSLMLSFDDNVFCVNNLPADIDIDPSRTLQSLDYKFVYTPSVTGTAKVPGTGEGDTDGKPNRDAGDISGGS